MIDLAAVLSNLALGVGANAIYDAIKNYITSSPECSREGLERALQDVIRVSGQTIRAATIVDVLAQSGAIVFKDSSIYAPDQISYVATNGSRVTFGGTGRSETKTTAITSTGRNARMDIEGNGAVRQNPDGSISFHTGPDGTIKFSV
jgi:hypothetical protein